MLSEVGSSERRSCAVEAPHTFRYYVDLSEEFPPEIVEELSSLRLQSNTQMHPARIAELLQPFLPATPNPCHSEPASFAGEESAVLSATQLQHISTYIDILLHWNARINLTAIRSEEEIVTRHFGESLFAARHLFPKAYPVSEACPERSRRAPPVVKAFDFAAARLADLGSGAGFPGIPIKLWAPQISVTLIESNHKKSTFLREVVRSLTLTDINVQDIRAETLPPSSFDVVTLRAVERLHEVLPVAADLLAPGGRLALLISSVQVEGTCSALPNFTWKSSISIPNSQFRQLLCGIKEP
jgi:16S rRNA (guanine527-N7)-methyltransferase